MLAILKSFQPKESPDIQQLIEERAQLGLAMVFFLRNTMTPS